MTQDTQDATTFADFAKAHNITFLACVPSLTRPDDGYRDPEWDKKATHYNITLTMGDKVIWSGWYSMGWGSALDYAVKNRTRAGFHGSFRCALDQQAEKPNHGKFKQWFIDDCRKLAIKGPKPLLPSVANVLQSVVLDIIDCDERFEDWANGLGYDTDSRKVYRIWEACNDTRRQLRSAMGEKLLADLQECEEV
jgi:hypothetical protein